MPYVPGLDPWGERQGDRSGGQTQMSQLWQAQMGVSCRGEASCKDESLEGVELESDSGTEEGGNGSWVIFPKKVTLQEAHKTQEGVRGSSLPFLFAFLWPRLAQLQEVGDP